MNDVVDTGDRMQWIAECRTDGVACGVDGRVQTLRAHAVDEQFRNGALIQTGARCFDDLSKK